MHTIIYIYIYIYILAPIWGGSGTRSPLIFWDTFPRYLRILFHPKKKKENDNYDQNWLKKGVGPLNRGKRIEYKFKATGLKNTNSKIIENVKKCIPN